MSYPCNESNVKRYMPEGVEPLSPPCGKKFGSVKGISTHVDRVHNPLAQEKWANSVLKRSATMERKKNGAVGSHPSHPKLPNISLSSFAESRPRQDWKRVTLPGRFYQCPIPGCSKRSININALTTHIRMVHHISTRGMGLANMAPILEKSNRNGIGNGNGGHAPSPAATPAGPPPTINEVVDSLKMKQDLYHEIYRQVIADIERMMKA